MTDMEMERFPLGQVCHESARDDLYGLGEQYPAIHRSAQPGDRPGDHSPSSQVVPDQDGNLGIDLLCRSDIGDMAAFDVVL